MTPETRPPAGAIHSSRLIRRQWLTEDTFTLALERPANFRFTAGQRIRLPVGAIPRDYSLIPGDSADELLLLIRFVPGGRTTRLLSTLPEGKPLQFEGPGGHFIHRPSTRQAVFVATGTGIAPFAAMARAGVTGFVLLHGARNANDLYLRHMVASPAAQYIPCLTDPQPPPAVDAYQGRVTAYIQTHLTAGEYDFYLAGRREMIADMIKTIDDHFVSSRVYSEIFF